MRISDWSSDVCSSDLNLADPGRILIASPDPGIVEALSPGGWSDCADARERTWMFLVGDNAAAEQFGLRSEEHTSELQSLMRISYAVFCLTKKKTNTHDSHPSTP